jgi:hypothetical protein
MKAIYTLLLIALLLAACGPGDGEPAATLPTEAQEEAEAVAVVATDTALPESPNTAAEPERATAVPTAETAAETVAEPTAEAAEAAAGAEAPEQAPAEPEPAEAATVNGSYEGTYFRGSADAPVTMIDYSDFL